MSWFLPKICILILHVLYTNATDDIIVNISNGPIIGEIRTNELTGSRYTAFHAIPYAKPPLSELRFKPPERFSERWNKPYDASNSSNAPICPQLKEGNFMNLQDDQLNEDCLYLSVYSPIHIRTIISEFLPVLVWIHGGTFDRGTGMYQYHGPERFIEGDDIIMVSINYRVGILGFLSLGTQEIPGNMGLLDQVMALRWVQENIQAFGGDPSRVTIMGESAGSWSSYYHLFSPLSQGLFHRIIAQSGTPMSPAYHEYTGEMASRFGHLLAAELGCGQYNRSIVKEAMPFKTNQIECLRNLSTADIVYTPGSFGRSVLGPKGSQAVIDGAYSQSPFLPKPIKESMKSGEYNTNVDILLGSNKDDGLEFTAQLHQNQSLLKLYKERWFDPEFNFGAQNLFVVDDFQHIDESINEKVKQVTNFYLGSIDYLDIVNITHFTMMYTDAWYFFSAHDFISKHLPNIKNGNKIYQYHYTHQGENALSVELGLGGPYGVGHCDETFLQFHPYMNKRFLLNKADLLQSIMIISSWKNFVKTGDPSTDLVSWSPVENVRSRSYLNIKLDSAMEYSADVDKRMTFWDELINTNAANINIRILGLHIFPLLIIIYSSYILK